jgi:hypothetical protein
MALTNRNLITAYTFNAAAKTINLTGIAAVNLARITLIENKTRGVVYYKPVDTASVLTAAANVITLNPSISTTGHANTDVLHIAYVEDSGAANYTESSSIVWIANVAGTGYAAGERLLQVLKNNGGVAGVAWFNIDQSTALATAPTPAQIQANLGIWLAPSVPASYKPKNKWIVTMPNSTPGSASAFGSSSYTFAIRNTNSFAARIISLEMSARMVSGANTNLPYSARMFTGTTSYSGSTTALSVINAKTYTSDSSLTAAFMPTGLTGTPVEVGMGNMQIVPYNAASFATGNTSAKWADGLIIPAGGMLAIQGAAGFSSPPSTTYPDFACVLTDEL